MAVHYRYTTNRGTVDLRMKIPQSPAEKLRGELYAQEQIDWLHRNEQNKVRERVELGQLSDDGLKLRTVVVVDEDGNESKPPAV